MRLAFSPDLDTRWDVRILVSATIAWLCLSGKAGASGAELATPESATTTAMSMRVSAPESIPTFWPEVPRMIAIGDLHGDMEATRRALDLAGAIDDEGHWAGGDLVLVQTGDQLDRGDDEQAILDWLARLSEEAAQVGGRVHVLNGNHELMNVGLDLRYVTEGGFADFVDALEMDEADSLLLAYPPEQRARIAALRPGGVYARLLARRNIIVQIGRNVFVHGGVLPEHIAYGLERLNDETRQWMRGEAARPKASDSVIWTRLYSDEVDEQDCRMLAEVLAALSADRMIVGHTPQDDGITSFCDGRVWCIDVGMAAHYGGPTQVLEISGDGVRILPSTNDRH